MVDLEKKLASTLKEHDKLRRLINEKKGLEEKVDEKLKSIESQYKEISALVRNERECSEDPKDLAIIVGLYEIGCDATNGAKYLNYIADFENDYKSFQKDLYKHAGELLVIKDKENENITIVSIGKDPKIKYDIMNWGMVIPHNG